MGLQLPGELTYLLNLVGYTWPEADETKLFEMGNRWISFGGDMQEILGQAESGAAAVWTTNRGTDIEAFSAAWNHEDGPRNVLADGSTAAVLTGTGLIICGAIVLALKINVIVQLIVLAIQIAQAIAMAAPTFGASLAEIPIFQAITRMLVGALIDQVIGVLLDA